MSSSCLKESCVPKQSNWHHPSSFHLKKLFVINHSTRANHSNVNPLLLDKIFVIFIVQ
jgi:hypothetical protein